MIREYIATGKTLDEARNAAKAGLNAPAKFLLDVHEEVLVQPRKKILGLFGGADAKVRAWYDDGVSEAKAKKPEKTQKQKKQPAPQQAKKADGKEAPKKEQPQKEQPKKPQPKKDNKKAPAKQQRPENKPQPVKEAPKAEAKAEEKKDFPASVDLAYAKAYFEAILKGLRVEAENVNVTYKEGVVTITLDCEDYGIIIGTRGATLDSIQYLISLAMKKHENAYVRVTIDVGDYREKRNETLRNLARKNAQYVLRTKRRYTFEPMTPYDRRIIHTAIQEIEGVESRSIGANQDRRVVLEPTGGAVKGGRGQKRDSGRRGGRGGASRGTSKAPENYVPKADRADLPKFGKIQVNNPADGE